MKPSDIRNLIKARPFYPFELRTSDGEVYSVRTPEIMVSDTMTVILDNGEFRFVDNDAVVSMKRVNSRGRRNG